MANRRVCVVRSVKVNGEWKFLSLPQGRKLKIPTSEGRYYISWREGHRKIRLRAEDYGDAYSKKLKKEAELAAVAAGVEVVPEDPKRLRFADAMQQFTDDLELRDRRKRTRGAYRLVISGFRAVCQKQFLDQVERGDLLRYAASLRKEGLSPRTVHNRWMSLLTILKHFGIDKLVKRNDAPKYVETEPEAYTREELAQFFTACKDERQRLLFDFFLKTGARMQEAMYCTWSDLNLKAKTFTVRAKPQFGFRPKSWEERVIPLEDCLAQALARFQSGMKVSALVFPTRTGKPNTKMLLLCKRIASRAKLDADSFWLHKFRASFATWHLQSGVDIRTVQMWLGHKDIASTMRYLQPARGKAINDKFNATFAGM